MCRAASLRFQGAPHPELVLGSLSSLWYPFSCLLVAWPGLWSGELLSLLGPGRQQNSQRCLRLREGEQWTIHSHYEDIMLTEKQNPRSKKEG